VDKTTIPVTIPSYSKLSFAGFSVWQVVRLYSIILHELIECTTSDVAYNRAPCGRDGQRFLSFFELQRDCMNPLSHHME
jgi:hypothetical protein